jgi:hypothetical protein
MYGVTEETVAAHSDLHATREALLLAALSDATWPASDMRMTELVVELMIQHCLSFSISARRHLSVRKAEGVEVPDLSARLPRRLNVESYSGGLWRALQTIVHSKSIMVLPISVGEDRFGKSGDVRICYLKVTDENGNSEYYCPFGLAHSYLGRNGRTDPEM